LRFRILKSVGNLLFDSAAGGSDSDLVLYINKTNVNRAIITSIFFIIIEAVMVIVYFIANNNGFYKKPDIYYFYMYILMLLTMICFLLFFINVKKNVSRHDKSINYSGNLFGGFILLWCAGVSLLDQFSNGQVIVYAVAVISVAVTPFYKPSVLLWIYLITHVLFLILLPYFQDSKDLLFGNCINTTSTVIIAWVISYMRYKKVAEDVVTKRTI